MRRPRETSKGTISPCPRAITCLTKPEVVSQTSTAMARAGSALTPRSSFAQGPVRIQKASFALPDRCATPAPGGEQDWLARATAHFCGEVVLSAGTARGLTDERDGVPLILSGVLPGRSGNPHVAVLPSDPPFLIGQGGVLDRGDQRPVLAYRAVLQPGPAEADRFE